MTTRVRAAAAALAVVAGSLTFATAGTGSAYAAAASCPANGQVLGPIQSIKAGSQTIGQFYLGWNCNGAYTEVNIWNTNYVNANWHYGQVDVKSSSHHSVNSNAPVMNQSTWWFDAGYIPVTGVTNSRLYTGNWNFTAGNYSCSGQTPTWNFSIGQYDATNMSSHCNLR